LSGQTRELRKRELRRDQPATWINSHALVRTQGLSRAQFQGSLKRRWVRKRQLRGKVMTSRKGQRPNLWFNAVSEMQLLFLRPGADKTRINLQAVRFIELLCRRP